MATSLSPHVPATPVARPRANALDRARDAARRTGTSLLGAARDVVDAAGDVGSRVLVLGRRGTDAVLATAGSVRQAIPAEAIPEIASSVRRLRKVRTPRQAVAAFETETERLLGVITPILVDHPLPVRSTAAARSLVATAGGLAAAGEEADEIIGFVSGGAAVPPTLPIVIAANLVALAVEISVAASLRVHDLRDAGLEPDPHEIARDVVLAMTGTTADDGGMTRHVTKQMVRSIATRVLARWSTGLVPVAGIVYSGWDAQRTVEAVRSLPLPARAAIRP